MPAVEEITNINNNNLGLKQENQINKTSFSPKNIIIPIIYSILLAFMLLTITRVPYTGIYFDACFNYIFGSVVKYFWYLLILFTLFLTFFKKTRSWFLVHFKKTWFLFIFLFFACECIVTCLWLLQLQTQEIQVSIIINSYHKFFQDLTNNSLDWIQSFIHLPLTGGVFSGILCSFLYSSSLSILIAFASLIALFLFILIILFLVNKSHVLAFIKSKIIKTLDKQLKEDPIDEFVTATPNANLKFAQTKAKKKIKQKYLNNHLIDLLLTTEYDYSSENKKKAMSYQKEITQFFKKEEITFFNSDIKCFPSFLEIVFTVDKQDIQRIEELQNDFFEIFQKKDLSVAIKGNKVGFKFAPYHFSPLTLHKYFQTLSSCKPYDIAVGITNDKQKPVKINLLQIKNVLLLGKKDSGSATTLIAMLTSLMFSAFDHSFDLFFVGNTIDPTYVKLNKCKLFNSKIINTYSEIVTFLTEINNEIYQKQRLSKLQKKEINSANKPKVIVLPRFGLTFTKNDEITTALLNILKYGPSCNIHCFIQSREADELIMSNSFLRTLSHLYLFKIDSDKASYKLIGDTKATSLYSWGDCYALDNPLSKDYLHISTCYISRHELDYNLNVLNASYDQKNKKNA